MSRFRAKELVQNGRLEAPPLLEALVALNAAVFLAWLALPRRWMARHFEVAACKLARRPWTAAAATVSHANLFDLTGNMQARQAGRQIPHFRVSPCLCCRWAAAAETIHANLSSRRFWLPDAALHGRSCWQTWPHAF